jgi:predicted nucleic acid-binding protein
VRYWDASALVPLLVEQRWSKPMAAHALQDPHRITWWGSTVECASAICRLEREKHLGRVEAGVALKRLQELAAGWNEINAGEGLREQALRLLRVHPLRAADALQLAAAIYAAEQRPATLDFVCLDERLAQAAEREGFTVLR